MGFTHAQKLLILRAREIAERVERSGGSLHIITPEEAEVLLDVISIMEEHQEEDPGESLQAIIDRYDS